MSNFQPRIVTNRQPTTDNPKPTTDNPKPTTDNPKPTTNNRQPKTDNPKPTTQNRQPKTDNPKPTTQNRQPKTNNQQPTTQNQQPKTNNPKPTTQNRQPKTDNRQPTTDNQQPKTKNPKPTTDNRQPTTQNQQPSSISLPHFRTLLMFSIFCIFVFKYYLQIMKLNKILFSTLGFIPCVNSNAEPVQKSFNQPNVVLVLVDDLGWKDVGFMGSKFFETPNIDKLAKQGVVFTNAYAACAVCSPTRASIQTGRYPARVGITDWIRARFQQNTTEVSAPLPFEENGNKKLRTPSNPFWMELSEVTIGEVLKKAGYFTCHIGKWHLGTDDYYPEKQGYDVNIAGCDMGQPVNYFDPYTNEKGVGFPNLKSRQKGEYLEDRLASDLKTVIEQHKDKPFFINMCNYAVHTPLMAKAEIIKKYESKKVIDGQKNVVYAAMIESMDQAVGSLMNTLKDNDLIDNTIVIFLSDNGGLIGPTDNSPLRSGKGYPYEGGIRIPMIVSWNGNIPAGSVCDLPVSTVDVLPTVCALTKTTLPKNEIDGRDISPSLYHKKIKEVPLFWHFPHYRTPDVVPYSIIRDGDWKLIKRYEGVEFELFNLIKDPFEQTDLSKSKPDKVKEMNRKLEIWLKDTHAKMPMAK